MSKKPPNESGVVALPTNHSPVDPGEARRAALIADIEARVKSGEIDGAQADADLLEVALTRFEGLPPEAIDELRAFGRELIAMPEMTETRLAPSDDDDVPAPSPWKIPPEGRGG